MTIIDLVLICALTHQPPQPKVELPPDHQIALVFSPTRTRRMRLDRAQRLHKALEARKVAAGLGANDTRLHAALTIALGTLQDERLIAPRVGTRERMDWEVRRGVKGATQAPRKD